jgi:phosphate acetyltransferase
MSSVLTNEIIENKTFDELKLGESARLIRTLTRQDIDGFAAVSGDTNPTHLDSSYAAGNTEVHEIVGHSMWSGALVSSVLGNTLPGTGTVYLDQQLHFQQPVRLGDTLTVTVTVTHKEPSNHTVTFDCLVVNQHQEKVAFGKAVVIAPTQKVRREKIQAPRMQLFDPDARLRALLALGEHLEPVRCGIVHPCEEGALTGAIEAADNNLIIPVLIGPAQKIRSIAAAHQLDISRFELIDAPHSHAAAEIAAQVAAEGKLEALMKGSLHTDELMHAVISIPKLRTKRRISHIFRFEVPLYSKPLLISDAAINIKPSLMEKADIIQNAIQLAHILGNPTPKVAILSAVETVNPTMVSTLDAAALCKMADRGQIKGAELDGPLAFDNAISLEAARIKGIRSSVAGQADILIAPDLESANMIGKQLEYLAGATGSGIVLGARIPMALTSRADGPAARIASALLVKLVAHHYRHEKP